MNWPSSSSSSANAPYQHRFTLGCNDSLLGVTRAAIMVSVSNCAAGASCQSCAFWLSFIYSSIFSRWFSFQRLHSCSPRVPLLLRDAVCLMQNLLFLNTELGWFFFHFLMKYFVPVAVWNFFSGHLLIQHPAESAALVAQFHTNALMQHLMALQAFLATLNDVLIACILPHSHTWDSHGCTQINPTSFLIVLLLSACCCPLYPHFVAHN